MTPRKEGDEPHSNHQNDQPASPDSVDSSTVQPGTPPMPHMEGLDAPSTRANSPQQEELGEILEYLDGPNIHEVRSFQSLNQEAQSNQHQQQAYQPQLGPGEVPNYAYNFQYFRRGSHAPQLNYFITESLPITFNVGDFVRLLQQPENEQVRWEVMLALLRTEFDLAGMELNRYFP